MPNYKGHLIGGFVGYLCMVCALLWYAYHPTLLTMIEWLLFALVGALFPDIDTKSKGQKIFYQIIGLLCIFLFIQQQYRTLSIICIIALLPLILRHRGLSHSIWFIMLMCFLVIVYAHFQLPSLAYALTFDAFFFFVGAFTHIALDFGIKRSLGFK